MADSEPPVRVTNVGVKVDPSRRASPGASEISGICGRRIGPDKITPRAAPPIPPHTGRHQHHHHGSYYSDFEFSNSTSSIFHRFSSVFIDFHRFSKIAWQQLENHEKMEGRRKLASGCLGHAARSPGTQRSGILKNCTVLDDPGLFFHKFSRKSIFSKIDENR